MSCRTVIISSRCKLDYKMGYMVVRAEETKQIFIDEIAVLMIENPAVSLTGCLLEALTKKGQGHFLRCNKVSKLRTCSVSQFVRLFPKNQIPDSME